MLDEVVEEIGEENVVQCVTDSAAAYVKAGELLMEKRQHLFWSPCAAHCLDLILEDMGKLPTHTEIVEKCRCITVFIYKHSWVLNLMRTWTKGRELTRPAMTRFATQYLTLQSVMAQRGGLRRMFTSIEWEGSAFSRGVEGKKVANIILSDYTFWEGIKYCIKSTLPLVKVLRLVDGDAKPAMGYIYEAMDRAKEQIARNFGKVKKNYEVFWKIIDERWNLQLHRPLHAAGYYLNPQFHYEDTFHADFEVKRGLYDCIERMVSDKRERILIDQQIDYFTLAEGGFGREMVKETRKIKQLAIWWERYGYDCPALQKFAIRVLSLTCSATGCERNWSVFDQVLHLLRKYLGEYVQGLSTEALRISVWKGDVVLKDLQLKAEALNALNLPVIVKAGFVGTITLKVPWKSLGKEPVIVLIDRVFVLAHPAPDGHTLKEEDREKLFEAKLQQIEETELATLEATSKRAKLGSLPSGNSWLGSLIGTVIGNLKITISNVHIRYEDTVSNPGHPFCSGVTLAKLAAVTMDELGNETFDTSGALDKLRKSLQLQRLAVYHDSDTLPWRLDKKWEDLSPREWKEIFEDGINEPTPDCQTASVWALNRKYLISPINGLLKYHRLGKQERKDPEIPYEKASIVLSDVSLSVLEGQYHDGIKILEVFSRYRTRVDVSHLRPMVPVFTDRLVWWRYAVQAGLQQKKMCYRFSWDRIRHLCQLRRRYIQLYASSLQQMYKVDTLELRQIEKDLDSKVILLWRLLAHAKVESKEAAQQRDNQRRSWWSFGWRSSTGDLSSLNNDSKESQLREKDRLTKEEWQAINNLLSYQPEEEITFSSGKDMQNMIKFLVNVSIAQGACRIICSDQTEIVCGRFEQLQVTTKLYHKSVHCDVSLRFYGLRAPEGSLVQSVSSEKKINALAASFVYSPVGESVDWRLSATIAPCHVTVLMGSYNRFLDFVKSSSAVSPTVASETAAALQMKIEKVSRRAQEQIQMVLEEQSRFALDVDFDAPIVRVPMRTHETSNEGYFLLDFGHFTLHTKEDQRVEQRLSLYSRFHISGRDIAAFFMDGDSDSWNSNLLHSVLDDRPSTSPISDDNLDDFYSLIDRCGMAVVVDQIKVPHPSYPSTRVSVQVPCLGIHFSPQRYSRLMDLLNILYGTVESSNEAAEGYVQTSVMSKYPADLATNARILVWRGIGNSVAEWKPCFLVLSGLYLFVLESEGSQSYQRCASLAGRQVFEVSPTSVGGSLCSVAVCFRGADIQKALESSNTLIIEFQDDEEKVTWMKGLTRATYRASTPPSIDILEEPSSGGVSQYGSTRITTSEAADLVVNGAIIETKLLIYGKVGQEKRESLEESLILELLAGGAKVNLARLGGDLEVKMKLHSLKIKDELQGQVFGSPQYLACSMLKDVAAAASVTSDPDLKDLPKAFMDEDDIFRDALSDFMSTPEQSFNLPNNHTAHSSKMGPNELNEFSSGGDTSGTLSFDRELEKGWTITNEEFFEAQDYDTSDFVAVTLMTRSPGSPLYDGTDTQMSIRMSKLDFLCNRPTIVALIEFGIDLSLANSILSSPTEEDTPLENRDREKTEESGHAYVTGLLGYGKGRVVFRLKMDVGSLCVFLNKEDGSQLAMLVHERFLLDLKIHPSSLSIEGTLGNLRLCDMSLGPEHCWGWLCDIRNQGTKSLIVFTFQSYSVDDDDYEGHDYSLHGRLSAVRIVFLYRFVQEITAYFMELTTPHTEEAIKFVDKVGGFEWLIQKYEIEGASALKLDLSLDTPLIIVPRNSMSKDFMQLDLCQLQVRNDFSWHGSPEEDPSAVHLDVLHAEIHGINLAVGVDGFLGKPMIREGQGLHVEVRRSLRDVFRKVPTFLLEVKVGVLHGVLSDKEYSVILDCAYMNLWEEPNLPPSFRSNTSQSKDSMRMLADKVNLHGQMLLSRTISLMEVEVKYALLELCHGIDEESRLAHLVLEGLWISYRTTSLSEVDLYVTIPKFSVLDIRSHTKPEMHLMLGSSTDILKQASGCTTNYPVSLIEDGSERKNLESSTQADIPNLTMLLLDYRIRSNSKSFVIRIQQPHVLVVLDFLLALCEFFVPALGSITGREEMLDPRNDPITKTRNIILSGSVYEQTDDVVHLSPNRQLIVDAFGVDEFTYDGCGKTICLSEEFNLKENLSSRPQPIIIIGRGKKVQFKNVKFENGALLTKCTYLSNDSSYSVSAEDGVDISLLESFASDMDSEGFDRFQGASSMSTVASPYNDNVVNQMQSVTFEAQVVSPEFTFYDSTKMSLDDSLHGEKLLRAKMDLSFMFASKESDTWVRALVKDLTVEAGSGLVVLDPVDISGGYTSVKDKTNISMLSTDVCVHLPLSVISLVLHLQDQTTAALQFGNANPLASCINFEQLWVSQRDDGRGPSYNLTFWRPQAPSNYAILGDCVTSRPTPPSQAVMAVSNTYGRVRKPLGFELIGLFSSFQGLEVNTCKYDADNDCSLWMPIAPPGYSTVGCVVNKGREPPPNNIVYCLRSDLVTSTTFSECIISIPPNPRMSTGFSIWRLDNVLGSFYAHATMEFPPKMNGCDLHQILFRNPSLHISSSNSPTQSLSDGNNYRYQKGVNESSSSSGWEVLRSISKMGNFYVSTPHFERIWWDKGCDLRRPISIWRPIPRPGFSILGDCITEGLEPPALGLVFKFDSSGIAAKPVQFAKVAHIIGKGRDEAYFWYPVAPPGYAALGCIVSKTDEAPNLDSFCCPRIDLVHQSNIREVPISRSSSSKGSHSWSIWKVENQAGTFLARSDLKKPSNRLAYGIGDHVKPRPREDVSAEIKLGCFSLTVLDSLCGMMTPLFDMTITNINLATHGRPESMNAVLISSIAASTFNTQLEAWEPLVEPFDGIFKFETYDASVRFPPRIGKRVRIAATSTLNLNISAANLDIVAESVVSWRRQAELEWSSTKEAVNNPSNGDGTTFSALEEDFQKLIIENNLGCDIYLKKFEENSEMVVLVQHEECASAWLPPPRFSDRLNVAAGSRDPRCYVGVQIFEAKGLPIIDDGNKHDFFCALRLVIDGQPSDQQKFFPQSARTRSVKPVVSKSTEMNEVVAKWNELFIFEVPTKGLAKLEVEVTNLASRSGKGEVIGSFSISIGKSAGTLKRASSVKVLHHPVDSQNLTSYPLKKRSQSAVENGVRDSSSLLVSTFYFEKKTVVNFQREIESTIFTDREVGFWVGVHPEGPWESFRSLLPLSVVPKTLNHSLFALEVVMKSGKKHAILRGLAVVVNDADATLEVSLCPISMLNTDTYTTSETNNLVIEEVFENQRFQPISGWGNKWHNFRANDPTRWSTRNFSYSSKDFFEPPIPQGWQWTSGWSVEKSQFVDSEGWAYGADFQTLKWPPSSSKSCTKSSLDFVRRRRWIRPRKQLPDNNPSRTRNFVTTIKPKSSAVLPWKSMANDSDLCLQVRPYAEHPRRPYMWGQSVTVGTGVMGSDQSYSELGSFSRQNTMKSGNATLPFFKLNQLEKKDMLLYCKPGDGSQQQFWLSAGSDALVLHTELNSPVYDWKISINAPLKLENKLPCQAEYSIWEKTKEGNRVERQHGIISSGGIVFIYSTDLQRPIYLTLFVQGGWVLEKDPVLISDPSSPEHVSSLWMVHQPSNRRLRVSIERDLGGTTAATKTIRLFVPYWIVNDSLLPLTYRIVEVETMDNADTDSRSLSRAVKSAKLALKHPIYSTDGKKPSSRKNIQILETIEEQNPTPVMLSPQDYLTRGSILSFQARNDAFLLPRVGIAVALRHSEHYSLGISLQELENKAKVDVKAFNSNRSYYRLSALLTMASNRTKVIHFQPQTLLINRTGCTISLQQCDTQSVDLFHPTDPPKMFQWQSTGKSELLKLRLDGFKWSTPFSIENEGMMCVCLKNEVGNDMRYLRVEVRNGTKDSRCEVLFRHSSFSSPFRIENRSVFLPLRFRQVDGTDNSWHSLSPNSASSFCWEDLGRKRLLEVLVDGTDPIKSQKYNIDELVDHLPLEISGGPIRALRVTVAKEGKMHVVKISDWMPANEPETATPRKTPLALPRSSEVDPMQSSTSLECEFHVIVELAEFGLSVIDHTPEEILYLSLQNLLLSYSTGLGAGISRFKLRMLGIQVDNQLPLTPMPVLFRPQRVEGQLDYILKLSVTMQSNGSLDLCVYPYIGFQGPESSAFLINIHEPIIWRLHEMIQQVKPSRIFGAQTTAVSVDPTIQIGLLNISEIRFKVSLAMSPTQRPRGVLGFWSSLMTALGNTEHMPIRIHSRFLEDVCMRQSALVSVAKSSIQKDLLSQPLQLLSGVDILGNASSALGHMSKGVAALSMDKKFIQSRQRKENKGIEDIGDVIREGGGALAKGFFRGVTGILTKPLEGAKSSGVEGFVQGVGKGIIGAAAQPVSGVLDLLSKTTEGANAVRMKISSAITSEEQLLRRRFPRVIGGDNLLRPYDNYKAQGQIILQLAECGAFFGQVDLFKVRGKFALSDAYEDHFLLPKGKIAIVTHRRILLLQQPSNIMAQRKFNPAREPCSVLWDVLWDDLATMELTNGKKDNPRSPPSQLIFHLKNRSSDSKDCTRVIKCSRDSQQAFEIYTCIDQTINTFGPKHSKEMQKKKVPKPYSPFCGGSSSVVPKEVGVGMWESQEAPEAVSLSSTFGTMLGQSQFE